MLYNWETDEFGEVAKEKGYLWGKSRTVISSDKVLIFNAFGELKVTAEAGDILYDSIVASWIALEDGVKYSDKWWFNTGNWWRFNKDKDLNKTQLKVKEIWEKYSPMTFEEDWDD